MTEKASLIIEVIEHGVKKTTIDLKSLGSAAKEAETKTNDLGKSFSSADSKAAQLGIRMTMLSKVAATYLSYEAVKKAMAIADSMQNIRTQVQLVTSSHEEAIRVQKELFSIATRTYSNLEATTTLYTRTARALKDAGKSQADFLKFTEAINNAMRIGGANATEQASALLQLSQALGSGVLQGDEFRSIAENAPILLDLVAKELGVVRGEVKALSAEGKITSEVLFSALTKSADQLAQDASKVIVTGAAAMENLKTNLYTYADGMLNASGITSGFVNVISFLSNNIEFVFAPIVGGTAVYAVLKLRTALMGLTAAGGPIMIAIGVISMLASAWNHNSKEIEKMRGEIGLATEDLLKMSKAQVEAHEVKLKIVVKDDKASLKELEDNLKDKEKRLAILSDSISKMNEGTRNNKDNATNIQYAELKDSIAPLREEFEALSDSIARNEAQLKKMPSILKSVEYSDFYKGFHGPMPELQGPVKPKGVDDINKALEEYKKKSDEAKIKTHEQAMTLLLQDDAFKDLNETIKQNYILRAAQIDTDNKAENSAAAVVKMLEELKDRADKAGKSMREVMLIDLRKNGATDGQIKQAEADLDRYAKNAPASGRSSADHYSDKLRDMSRELSEVLSLNKQLETSGFASQYNAVSQITLELSDQSSTLYKISDAQKQTLMTQAQQIDNAQQLNAIMNMGVDYDKRLSDLAFENSLMGKSKREIEALTFARELDYVAQQMSVGMSGANIQKLEEEITKRKELHGLIMMDKLEKENNIGESIQNGFQQYIDGIGNLRDQFAGATQSTFGHMEGFLTDFATTGKANFRDMTVSILQDISKMMIRMAMMQAVQGAMGLFSGGGAVGKISPGIPYQAWTGGIIPEYATGGKVIDFSTGGFTGAGGKFEPKGIVHGGEYVMSKAAVNTLGIGYLERLHNSAKSGRGYASGGIVGGAPTVPSFPKSKPVQANSDPISINIVVNTEDGTVETNEAELSAKLGRQIDVRVDRRIGEHKRSGGSLK